MGKFFNVHDVLVIGVIALISIWLANWLLRSAGLPQYQA